jgi:putative ABC transport system substrate-binding protein
MGIADSDPEAKPRVEAFQNGLQELGWTEGHNVHLDYRWTAGDPDRTLLFAKEIFDLKPDIIILVHSSPAVAALRQLTSKIPLVFVLIADPIGSGFVESLSHPGAPRTNHQTGRGISIAGDLPLSLLPDKRRPAVLRVRYGHSDRQPLMSIES